MLDEPRTFDVHTHFLPESCIDTASIDFASSLYTVRITSRTSDTALYRQDLVATGFDPDQLFGPERRRRDMARQGIDVQVLSVPPPIAFFYGLEPARSLDLCQIVNDGLARTVSADPDHFIALCTVPLQTPNEATVELERAVRELGLRGVEIGTNVAGRDLDDPALRPFYAKAQELDVPIFIHSTNAGALGGKRLERYHLANLIGNPTEDALAAASLIFGGVLRDFPRLGVLLAHGGGSCPFLRGRWEHGWHVRPEAKRHIQRPPSEYFGRLHFDSLTHGGPALQYLVETVGVERVMLGTDYPYDMGEQAPVRAISALPNLSDGDRRLILGGNAARLFGLNARGEALRSQAD
jgi:aminocarboxymuconate-semialdehyde decarboxylase